MRIALLALLLFSASASSATDFTVYPDGSGSYATIADAVAAASNGDRVLLMDGIFTGPGNREVSVFRDIEIRSGNTVGAAIIDCAGDALTPQRAFTFEYCQALLFGITIINGYADDGGALTIEEGQVTIEECFLNNNTATNRGGAIYTFEEAHTVLNTTVVSGNHGQGQGGGVYVDSSSDLQINHCSFLYNGSPAGGHFFFNEACTGSINSSVLAFGFEGTACTGYYQGTITATCSDIWNNSGGDWVGPLAGQLIGDNLSVDPQLCDPMGGNYRPIATSAIWEGTTCGMIGAFAPDFGWGDPVLGVAENGHGQYPNIQTAMDSAPAGATILLEDGNYIGPGNYLLDPVGKALTLRSRSGHRLNCTLDGQEPAYEENRYLLHLVNAEGPETIFQDLTFANCRGAESGAAVDIFGPVAASFINCVFRNNVSVLHGGAIRIDSEGQDPAQVSFQDCYFALNMAGGSGGSLVAVNWIPNLVNCSFHYEDALTYQGGAVHVREFNGGEIRDCYFLGCNALDGGGGLYLWNGGVEQTLVTECTFIICSNNGGGSGGAVKLLNPGSVGFEGCTFQNSISDSFGPDLEAESDSGAGLVEISDCTFIPAEESQGSLYFDNLEIRLNDCAFTDYTSDLEYGNTLTAVNSIVSVEDCQFENCTGSLGGAARFLNSEIMMNRCLFQGNHSPVFGGAIYAHLSELNLTECQFLNNSANANGGAITIGNTMAGRTNDFQFTIFAGNTTGNYGAAICLSAPNGNTHLDHCTIHDNETTSNSNSASQVYVATFTSFDLESTIISSSTTGQALVTGPDYLPEEITVTSSNIWGNLGGDWVGVLAPLYGQNYNFRLPPHFCDPTNHVLTLNDTSPCLPENNPASDRIGALGQDCWGIPTATEGPTLQKVILAGASPNPFNPITTLSYSLPAQTVVTLSIHDVSGRLVRRLVAGESQQPGEHQARWTGIDDSGRGVASGIYLVRLQAGMDVLMERMALIR